MTAEQKLQHIHRIACSPEYTPDEKLVLILHQFHPEDVQAALQAVISRRDRVTGAAGRFTGV